MTKAVAEFLALNRPRLRRALQQMNEKRYGGAARLIGEVLQDMLVLDNSNMAAYRAEERFVGHTRLPYGDAVTEGVRGIRRERS